jgi:hypothetical protein
VLYFTPTDLPPFLPSFHRRHPLFRTTRPPLTPRPGSHFRYGTIEWEWTEKNADGTPVTTGPNHLEVVVSHAWRKYTTFTKCGRFTSHLAFEWGDGTTETLGTGGSSTGQTLQCGGNNVQGNHVQELTSDYMLAKVKLRRTFSGGAKALTLKARVCCRIAGLQNAASKTAVFTSGVKNSIAFSPSGSSFPQLYVSAQTSQAEVSLAVCRAHAGCRRSEGGGGVAPSLSEVMAWRKTGWGFVPLATLLSLHACFVRKAKRTAPKCHGRQRHLILLHRASLSDHCHGLPRV